MFPVMLYHQAKDMAKLFLIYPFTEKNMPKKQMFLWERPKYHDLTVSHKLAGILLLLHVKL